MALAPQKYAVVMVGEDQLEQLMHRVAMRRAYPPVVVSDGDLRYRRLKQRLTAAAVVSLLALAGGGLLWALAPKRAMAAVPPAPGRVAGTDLLKTSAGPAAPSGLPEGGAPGVMLLSGGPDRLSFVLELPVEPRYVNLRRSAQSTLDLDVGPLSQPVQPQRWSVPGDASLLRAVAVDRHVSPTGAQYLRAQLDVPPLAGFDVRTEGRRVYVDLSWPSDSGLGIRDSGSGTRDSGSGTRDSGLWTGDRGLGPADPEGRYLAAIGPIHERVAEMRPFLLSAAQPDSVHVAVALDQALADLESSLEDLSVPASASASHELLLSATRLARQGLEPGFTGDRPAHAQKVLTLFDAAVAAANPLAR